MKRLIISAPFGNYIQPEGATATLGTFTVHPRPGRVWRVIRTVRYYPRLGAWVNRIGLRNPGIEWLLKRVDGGRMDVSDKIVSIHGFGDDDWYRLIDRLHALSPMAVELNISCPNIGHVNWPADLFERTVSMCGDDGLPIVKLPPVNYELILDQAIEAGIRTFHCCNTLPVPAGGLSGKPLKPVALQCIRDIHIRVGAETWNDLTIVGGGGITSTVDIDDYAEIGVRHVAIGTRAMNPRFLVSDRPLRDLAKYAHHRLEEAPPEPVPDVVT
ncbi:MAG: hypothetical protein RIB32_03225 [Phycisphaerales bacterium]